MNLSKSKRGRKPVAPLWDGPIPENSEYRAMVERILKEKRRREMLEAYRRREVGEK